MRHTRGVASVLVLGALALLVTGGAAFGQAASRQSAPEVSDAVAHAVSPPVMDMTLGQSSVLESPRVLAVRPIPVPAASGEPDPVVQVDSGSFVGTTTPISFAGVGKGDYGYSPNVAPPDTNLAVGATQIVQWVNTSFAVFDKSTDALIKGPVAGNTLFATLGGGCAANNDGDIIAQYDKLAKRWILTQFSVSSRPYLQCVAVSKTTDATGGYYLYAFSYGNTQFPDYPKLGVWRDAYYISFNIFTGGISFAGAKVCAYHRSAMLKGLAAKQVCFQLSTSYGGLLPADLDSAASPPALGTPEPFVNFGTNSLNVWRFLVNWTTPTSSTLNGPINFAVAPFTPACGGGTCIPQSGTKQKLDSLADRVMYRLAYRTKTLARAAESAVVNHSVKGPTAAAGIRWYQLANLTSGTPNVLQQSTFSPDAKSRWMGSIAMDKAGNIAVGYSESSGTSHPSIYYTGRLATDPLGTLQAEGLLKNGGGSQSGSKLSRWGDYSAIMVDPSDDCTFYYTTEYLKTTGNFNWSTWISSFKFPGC